MTHSIQTSDYLQTLRAACSYSKQTADIFEDYLQIPDLTTRECLAIYKSAIELLEYTRSATQYISEEFMRREVIVYRNLDPWYSTPHIYSRGIEYLHVEQALKIVEKNLIATILRYQEAVPIDQRIPVYKFHRPPKINSIFSIQEIIDGLLPLQHIPLARTGQEITYTPIYVDSPDSPDSHICCSCCRIEVSETEDGEVPNNAVEEESADSSPSDSSVVYSPIHPNSPPSSYTCSRGSTGSSKSDTPSQPALHSLKRTVSQRNIPQT